MKKKLLGCSFLLVFAGTVSVRGYEAREICKDVRLADGPFEFSGASCAAGTIIVFLPCSNCTEASIDMLGENGADRLREIEIACREKPRGLLRDLHLAGVRAVVRVVENRLARRTSASMARRVRKLHTNADLLAALDTLGMTTRRDPADAGVRNGQVSEDKAVPEHCPQPGV